MFLQELHIKQFRCFEDKKILFSKPITVIIGNNGMGKTSIMEAIYYLSYFKSFRTHTPLELMHTDADSFFLKGYFLQSSVVSLEEEYHQHSIQIGYNHKKKSIKFDEKPIVSYKDVLSFFQVVTLTEDDIDLIKGAPSARRAFIDQAVLIAQPESLELYRVFKTIVQHRNKLLDRYNHSDLLEFEIWTQKLWEISYKIQELRKKVALQIQYQVNQLMKQYFDDIYEITIMYEVKSIGKYDEFSLFWKDSTSLFEQERFARRSLFGAHLDDLAFQIKDKKARVFASRGQQKLIILLCKFSLTMIEGSNQSKPLFLIDDFISDFDKIRLKNLIKFFSICKNQIIITAPFFDSNLQELFALIDPEALSVISLQEAK